MLNRIVVDGYVLGGGRFGIMPLNWQETLAQSPEAFCSSVEMSSKRGILTEGYVVLSLKLMDEFEPSCVGVAMLSVNKASFSKAFGGSRSI